MHTSSQEIIPGEILFGPKNINDKAGKKKKSVIDIGVLQR